MEFLKYFRWTGIVCLLLTFIYGSASVFIIICTIGVIIYSEKFGIMSYVFALLSFVGWIVGKTYTSNSIDWIANDTYYSIQGETFLTMFFICLVASIIAAYKKGEADLIN